MGSPIAKLRSLSLLLALSACAVPVFAQEVTPTYDGCTGGRGEAVAAVADAALERVAEVRFDGGVASIHYNPARLPRLRPESRDFLFAHECARVNLRLPVGPTRGAADARDADCGAVAMLMRSQAIDEDALGALEADLVLSSDEWRQVHGPRRAFSLRSCAAEREPTLAAPAPRQADWNACVRACGDALRMCDRRCSRDDCAACGTGYDRCASLCDFK